MAILGIDEVGRGPWAGPLLVGAVILDDPLDSKWESLNDSKKLTAKKREKLSPFIIENARGYGIGWVSAAELDHIGLSAALRLATRRAVGQLLRMKSVNTVQDFSENLQKIPKSASATMPVETLADLPFDEIIIDGTSNFLVGTALEDLVSVLPKADAKIKEVSAASIIAKVARDNYMIEISKKYPEYGFEKHVGYGTALHRELLAKYGPCKEHRQSFKPVAKLIAAKTQTVNSRSAASQKTTQSKSVSHTTTTIGKRAENVVANYLKKQGHKIIARNYKTKFYEIDIISATSESIFFTEVKYRKNSNHGTPLEFIDAKKQKQIVFAANSFMKYLSKKLGRRIDNLPAPKIAAAAVVGKEFVLDKWLVIVV